MLERADVQRIKTSSYTECQPMSLIHGLNLYTRAKKRALQYLKGKTFGYTIFILQIVFPEKNCSTF